jgi:8-oxo-dGTP diphosphatase
MSRKKLYVVGLLFTEDRRFVVLLRKEHPAWQKGLLNGVGGKIELDEKPEDAMSREFKEETGLLVPTIAWQEFVRYHGGGDASADSGYRIHFFRAFGFSAEDAQTVTDEAVGLYSVDALCGHPKDNGLIKNLRWLIPLALDPDIDLPTVVYDGSQKLDGGRGR